MYIILTRICVKITVEIFNLYELFEIQCILYLKRI